MSFYWRGWPSRRTSWKKIVFSPRMALPMQYPAQFLLISTDGFSETFCHVYVATNPSGTLNYITEKY